MKLEISSYRWRFKEFLVFFLVIGTALALGFFAVRAPSLVYAILIVFTILLFLLKRWDIIILVVILSSSMISINLFSLGGTVFVAGYLLILFFAWQVLINRNKFNFLVKQTKSVWILFLVIVILNFLRNPKLPQILGGNAHTGGIGLSYFLNGLVLVCAFLLGPLVFQKKEDIKNFFGGLTLFLIIALGFAWANYLWGFSSVFTPGYGGTVFSDSTEFGTITRFGWIGNYAIYLLPLALAFLPNRRLMVKLSALLLLLVSIIISGGRTQLITFVVVVVVYIYLSSHKFGLAAVVLASFVIIYLSIFSLGINKKYPELNRFSLDFTTAQFTQTISGYSTSRLGVYEASLALIKTNPIFGVGPATSAETINLLDTYANDSIAHAREGTHATFINIAAILGIPALLIFLLALKSTFLKTLRTYWLSRKPFEKSSTQFVILFLISSVILYLSSGSSTGGTLYFYLIVGMAETLVNLHPQQLTPEKSISSN